VCQRTDTEQTAIKEFVQQKVAAAGEEEENRFSPKPPMITTTNKKKKSYQLFFFASQFLFDFDSGRKSQENHCALILGESRDESEILLITYFPSFN
jgi:hypothetical protein